MTRTLTRAGAALLAAAVGLGILLVPTAASAGVVTNIEFVTAGPINVEFGDAWAIVLSVESSYPEGPTTRLLPTEGTVDVFLSGIGGEYASDLQIQPDGLVYVSQSASKPLLAAGSYEVSAIFTPAQGGYYNTSQTAAPLVLTVTGLEVQPSVQVTNDPSVSELPVITGALAGSYVEKTGGAPAGTWHFTVTDPTSATLFETDLAQAQGAKDPVRVEVTGKLKQGTDYTVTSTFTPVVELAGGVTASDIATSTFRTPDGTFGEAITAPIGLPLWALIALGLILLGLVATSIILGVKMSGRDETDAADGPRTIPGDPQNVELVSLGELGLSEPETVPELRDPLDPPTVRLPESTTWLLSDVEPNPTAFDPSNAPTERLDAVTAAELPTELLDATDSTEIPESDKPADS